MNECRTGNHSVPEVSKDSKSARRQRSSARLPHFGRSRRRRSFTGLRGGVLIDVRDSDRQLRSTTSYTQVYKPLISQ